MFIDTNGEYSKALTDDKLNKVLDTSNAEKIAYIFLPIISSPKSLIFGLFSLNSYLMISAKVHEHSLYQVLNS